MKGKLFLVLLFVVLLSGAVFVSAGKEDGIECNSCSDCSEKLKWDFNVVFLEEDIFGRGDCVEIKGADVEFDCQGFLIEGKGYGDGIAVDSEGVTVKDCRIMNFGRGITIESSDEGKFISNELIDNSQGISLNRGDSNLIAENEFEGNLDGVRMVNSDGNMLESNEIRDNRASGVILVRAEENEFLNNYIGGGYYGVSMRDSSQNYFMGNAFRGNNKGVSAKGFSRENEFDRNVFMENEKGAFFESATRGNLVYNNIFENSENVDDDGRNVWNVGKKEGLNIIGGPFVGGNYWSDYSGFDLTGDGLGDTEVPYLKGMRWSGDFLPLVQFGNGWCMGADLDMGGNVAANDLSKFLSRLGDSCSVEDGFCGGADLDKDLSVSAQDLSIFLSKLGKSGCGGFDFL